MTRLERARIVRGDAPPVAERTPMVTPSEQRRVLDEELAARDTAHRLVAAAEEEARRLVDEARKSVEGIARVAAEEARASEVARHAALTLRLHHEAEVAADRDLDRAIGLATALAERLLGAALDLDPSVIEKLAAKVLSEARGARRAVIAASPEDMPALQHLVGNASLHPLTVEVRVDPSLGRGSLRVSTSLGNLDAQLRPQLERLAEALRDTLRHD